MQLKKEKKNTITIISNGLFTSLKSNYLQFLNVLVPNYIVCCLLIFGCEIIDFVTEKLVCLQQKFVDISFKMHLKLSTKAPISNNQDYVAIRVRIHRMKISTYHVTLN